MVAVTRPTVVARHKTSLLSPAARQADQEGNVRPTVTSPRPQLRQGASRPDLLGRLGAEGGLLWLKVVAESLATTYTAADVTAPGRNRRVVTVAAAAGHAQVSNKVVLIGARVQRPSERFRRQIPDNSVSRQIALVRSRYGLRPFRPLKRRRPVCFAAPKLARR